jgi:hypothetical protein
MKLVAIQRAGLAMKSSLVFPLVARLWAAELVTAAYLGILGRLPDAAGLKAHCAELGWPRMKAAKSLSELLASIARSPERWKRSLEQRADEVVRAAFWGVLRREPLEQELKTLTAQLRKSGSFSGLLTNLASSQEHWEQLLTARAEELTLELYRRLFGRDPASGVLTRHAGQLKTQRDLAGLLSAVGASQEFWERQIAHRAEELVRMAFRSLLRREPEEEALKAYAAQLKEHKNLEEILRAITQSPEHLDGVQRDGAEQLVRIAFRSLLNREPEEAALQAYAGGLRQGQSLAEMLASISRSQEHWELLLQEHAEAVVRGLFGALLKREPDSAGLAGHAEQLRATRDFAAVTATIANSREHQMILRKEEEWPDPAHTYDDATWVFMHVEKTGGTSLQNMLVQSFGPEAVYYEHQDRLHQHAPGELSTYSVFAGHFNHDSLAFIPRRRLRIFTFVREPRQRLLSLYHFWRAHEPSAPQFHESMKLARELNIETYYASRDVGRSPSTWNHMTWCIMGNRQWHAWQRLLRSAHGEKRARVVESLRAPIRARLREFAFVGLQEKFSRSCRELFRIMGRSSPEERTDHSVEQLATVNSYIRKSPKPVLSRRAIEAMAELVELDSIVYEEAKALFAERLTRRRKRARSGR